MRNINKYRKRFYNLMESTLGNVKPLISEAPQHEEFVTPTMDMLSYGEAHSSSDGTGGYGKTINSKTSLSGNEYKFTLAEGMYESLESISIGFWIDGKLKLQEKVLSTDITKSDNVTYTNVLKISAYGKRYINFKFNMPKTQNEFKEKSPFIAYIDVPCKNVRGGKLRFSAEVPSSSEIFESPEITERDLSRIVKRVLKESTEVPIKLKVFGPFDTQMARRDCNIEVTNLKVVGSRITFNYKIPGNGWCSLSQRKDFDIDLPPIGKGTIFCGDSKRQIEFGNDDETGNLGVLSKEGWARLSKKCNEYDK